jgi:SSS family solute:Na+ symporter
MLLAVVSSSRFSLVDWAVIAAYMIFTTILGARLAGKQSTIREFFLGGRKLPWWAISGSIIATEVSAATIVGVPTLSFAAGGNLTYLQWALGSILARIIVAYYFVPRFYENEIYSPYDYAGKRMGPRVKHATTSLFLIGAVLGQGARLYITAFVLSFVADIDFYLAIWLIGAFSVCWTLIGGMTSVIWTDVIQFGIVIVGAIVALIAAVIAVPGGISQIISTATAAGKFQLLDTSLDLSQKYTLLGGLVAMPFLNLAAFGTDQVMAQRMFCCRDVRDARKAILWSNLSLVIPVIMLLVGIALYVYFQVNPLSGPELSRLSQNKNYLLPIFVARALPMGIRALIVGAIFAAAISSLNGALTALAQSTLEPLQHLRGRNSGATSPRGDVFLSKLAVVLWAVMLCLMAIVCIQIATNYRNVIDLALSLSGYTYGPLLGIFLLAFLKIRRDDSGLPWAVALSILSIFAISVHTPWAEKVVWGVCGAAAAVACLMYWRAPQKVAAVLIAAGLILALHHLHFGDQTDHTERYLAFSWSYPVGTILTFALGYVLGNPAAVAVTAAVKPALNPVRVPPLDTPVC